MVDRIKTAIAAWLDAIRMTRTRHDWICDNLYAIRRDITTMTERFDTLDATLADLRGSVTGLLVIVRDARAQAEASAAALTAQIDELTASGAGSAGVIAALTAERDALQASAVAVDAEVAEAIESATATDAEVDAAVAEFSGGGTPTTTTTAPPPFTEPEEGGR